VTLCCAQMLSSLVVGEDMFLERCALTTRSGEEMTLTFALRREEGLQPSYRGLQFTNKWVLRAITGGPP
jgi:hypothetical protein